MKQFLEKLGEFISTGKIKGFILPAIALLVVLGGMLSGGLGLAEIRPGEAAVIYNTAFGKTAKVRLQQGTQTFIPILQRVEILNIEPHVLIMEGEETYAGEDRNRVNKLTVRARDGSKLWFNRLEIHYEAIPSSADVLHRYHGLGDVFVFVCCVVFSLFVLMSESC